MYSKIFYESLKIYKRCLILLFLLNIYNREYIYMHFIAYNCVTMIKKTISIFKNIYYKKRYAIKRGCNIV